MPYLELVAGTVATPIGTFGAVWTPAGLARLTFPNEPLSLCDEWIRRWEPRARVLRDPGHLHDLSAQLNAYFTGSLTDFSLPLDMRGTAFQQAVWQALTAIRYGQTCAYSDVAEAIGRPSAVRAVGAAIGANPVPVVVPCHRVIGKNGSLTGFAGGIPLKKQFLALEQKAVQLLG